MLNKCPQCENGVMFQIVEFQKEKNLFICNDCDYEVYEVVGRS